ncbi:MAG TPA: PPC domain-containing DNA-binding protein [Planctomycetaceae bacterium]|jgi:hypothetical protein
MKVKQICQDPSTYVLVLASGDEVNQQLLRFAGEQRPAGASFTAIGAFERCKLGYFDWQAKKYLENPIDEQVEVLSFIGNLTWDGEKPKLHAHVVVGLRDAAARGGHLLEAIVRPTLEITLVESPTHLQRRYDPQSRIPLIQLDRE